MVNRYPPTDQSQFVAPVRYCVNCKHHDHTRSECARPRDLGLNLVTGMPLRRIPSDAWYERYTESDTTCGKDAKYFEVNDGQ